MSLDIEQFSGLPKGSVVVRNVRSKARYRAGGVAQWFIKFKLATLWVQGFSPWVVTGEEGKKILYESVWSRPL